MSDVLIRQIRMLELVPRAPRSSTAPEIKKALERLGYSIDLRTIQRDLNALSAVYPLTGSANRPARWSWSEKATSLQIPSMAPEAALALHVAQSDLLRLLPRPLLAQLAPYFDAAASTLARLPGASLKRWRDRVLSLPFSLQLEPSVVSEEVIEVVHGALLDRRQLDVVYIPRTDKRSEIKRYRVNPLGLVVQDGAYYLVVTLFDYPDIRHLAVHRIQEACLLDEVAREPPGFSLSNYVATTQAFDYPVGKPIRLHLHVTSWLAQHLAERRLTTNQTLKPSKDSGWYWLIATVPDTQKLRWWLRALGPNARVLGPAKLRRDIENDLRQTLASYGRGADMTPRKKQ